MFYIHCFSSQRTHARNSLWCHKGQRYLPKQLSQVSDHNPKPDVGSTLLPQRDHLVYVTFKNMWKLQQRISFDRWQQTQGYIKSLWGCFFCFWMMNGVRPSHVFMCWGELMGNSALGQGSKHSERRDVDTPYLMDRLLRKHSLEHAAEKCLTHIGGMLLAGDVCKQQPSPSVVVGVRCKEPSGPYRMGVVRKTSLRCYHVFGISKSHNLICQATKRSILFCCQSQQGSEMFTTFPSSFWHQWPENNLYELLIRVSNKSL